MKKTLTIIFLICLFSTAFASITNYSVSPSVRLGENITITGTHSVANVLCKTVIYDSNQDGVERLSDEYTFADGSFYFERPAVEPPYYRGDDFNAVTTCGTDIVSETFTIFQPTNIVQSLQFNWEFLFDENNLEALSLLGAFVFFIIFLMVITAVVIKRIRGK